MIDKNRYIFILRKTSATYKLWSQFGCPIIEPFKLSSNWAYRIRHFVHLVGIEKFFPFLFSIPQELSNQAPSLIILGGSLLFESYIIKLRSLFPNVRIKYVYFNIVQSKASIEPKVLEKYNIEGLSWDKKDCEVYALNYIKPSFSRTILPQNEKFLYDACFIGRDKGRIKLIKKIEDTLQGLGYNCYFRISSRNVLLLKLHSYYSPPIPYSEYLDVIASSRCLIDLVQKGQTGTTMRVFEALFSQKKLITNNVCISSYDFYNKQNIFIIGVDSMDSIQEFMDSEYEPISESILESYTIESSFNKLIND